MPLEVSYLHDQDQLRVERVAATLLLLHKPELRLRVLQAPAASMLSVLATCDVPLLLEKFINRPSSPRIILSPPALGTNTMVGLQEFFDARVADLTVAQGLLSKAIQNKAVPSLNDVPSSAIYTSLAAIVGVQILVMMLTSKGRRVVLDTVETILAVALILVLLAVVIGCPIGA